MQKEWLKNLLFLFGLVVILGVLLSMMLFFDLVESSQVWGLLLAFTLLSIGIVYYTRWYGFLMGLLSVGLLSVIFLSHPFFLGSLICLSLAVLLLWKGVSHTIVMQYQTRTKEIDIELTAVNQKKYGRVQRRYWWSKEYELAQTYEWDDIHLTAWIGDTHINLEKTILPEETSFIVIHKAFGDVRIIVPIGVGVSLSHSTLRGNVLFEAEEYTLTNEHLRVYSENYSSASRCIDIITTIYVGNLEVVRL